MLPLALVPEVQADPMTTVSCEQCGKPVPVRTRGPRPKFCGPTCRQAAHRGAPGQDAAEAVATVSEGAPVTSGPQRGSYAGRDYGDGDACPQDPGHGRMFFMKPAMARQWCPSSRHQGNSFYARDGVTPAPRPLVEAEPAPHLGPLPALDSRRATEAPATGTRHASTQATNQPTPAMPVADHVGGGQLPLPLAAAP